MQTAIPCHFMRGGTSRGPFFLECDLPQKVQLRDRLLLAAKGSPDNRRIDDLIMRGEALVPNAVWDRGTVRSRAA